MGRERGRERGSKESDCMYARVQFYLQYSPICVLCL